MTREEQLLQRQRRLWWDIAIACGWFGFMAGMMLGWSLALVVMR